MLLKNYWENKRVYDQSGWPVLTQSPSASNPSGSPTSIKTLSGADFGYLWNWKTTDSPSNYSNLVVYASAQQCPFRHGLKNGNVTKPQVTFRVGTGTTQESIDDYALENDVTSSFSNSEYSSAYSSRNGHLVITATWIGTNNTADDILISEVGISSKFVCVIDPTKAMTASGNWSAKEVLVLRKVLDTPVLVPPGHTATIIVDIDES